MLSTKTVCKDNLLLSVSFLHTALPLTFIIFVTLTLNVNLYMFSIWSEMDTYLPDICPTKSSFLPICHLEEGDV